MKSDKKRFEDLKKIEILWEKLKKKERIKMEDGVGKMKDKNIVEGEGIEIMKGSKSKGKKKRDWEEI